MADPNYLANELYTRFSQIAVDILSDQIAFTDGEVDFTHAAFTPIS